MELGIERFNCSEDVRRRSRVSEMVLEGLCVRRRISDSIAAMGMVRSVSFRRRFLYVATMLQALLVGSGRQLDRETDSKGLEEFRVGTLPVVVILVMAGGFPAKGGGVCEGVRGGLASVEKNCVSWSASIFS